ncbi:hypothetical protein QYE76_015121 [Lolium multiflorum]|uniref:Uncharacterized protein n=1 Tax=Lolium multiflorum TaxID=4521 RepID=A0AAD8U607_LOLMU|nr:hypothetical protein QYE76_015121 [Lolium multiflorum]
MSGLAKPCSFPSTTTTTPSSWTLEEIYHTSAARWNGRGRSFIDTKLSDLGIVIPNKLGIHRVLQSPPPSYKNFVMNYNMQNMNKELPELFSMLKSAEVEIKKENQVLMVNKTTSFKKQGKPNKGNFKKGGKKGSASREA